MRLFEMFRGGLWQGDLLSAFQFSADIVVTCSPEGQVSALRPRLCHILFPFEDVAALPDMEIANSLAAFCAHEVGLGRRCLVHCSFGKNRSGLMTALVLFHMGIAHGDALVDYVRQRNDQAFTAPGDGGPFFATYLRGMVA